MLTAIETRYSGCRFRSRLEARWAVFFDALGIKWEYEPEGFEVISGRYSDESEARQKWNYLPDFRLTNLGAWVEVKGDWRTVCDDYWDMLAWSIDWGGALPGVDDSFGTTRGLILLGSVPEYSGGAPAHYILQHGKGGWVSDFHFTNCDGVLCIFGGWYFDASNGGIKETVESAGFFKDYHYPSYDMPGLKTAYTAARSARFEHGECP